MSTKALKSQLLAAVAMVLVSSIALGSSTYAWFSLNTKVVATGMVVKTQVSNNLFIANDTTDSSSAVAENTFTTSLVKNVTGVLEPVSTINGVDFFYTASNNAAVNGDALREEYIAYDLSQTSNKGNFGNDFENNYQANGAVGYVDYAFRLKAINTGATQQDVVLTGLNLIYGGSADAGAPAYRAVMFVQDLGTTQTAGADVAAGQVKGVYAKTGYEYQTVVDTKNQAVTSTSALADINFNSKTMNTAANSTIGVVAAGTTNYYKVVIRLWLEGEDKACTSTTFAALDDQWAMDVAVELKDHDTAGVAALTTGVTATKTALLTTDAVASSASITINGTSFYAITGKKLGGNDLYATSSSALTVSSKVYTVVDGYPVDVTNQVTISTPDVP